MPVKYNEVLNVDEKLFEDAGIFNGFIDIDSSFYVDPHLLKSVKTPELLSADNHFKSHFEQVLTLLSSSNGHDALYRESTRRLTFHEVPYVGLGFSKTSNKGSGIGYGIAKRLTSTAYEIIQAGIKEIEIFELIGLVEDNIGSDRISDMTLSIILKELLEFTQRVARDLKLKTDSVRYNEESYEIPLSEHDGKIVRMLLIPKEILRTLPTAFDWSDFDYVSAHNAALRNKVNKEIGDTWKKATKNVSKERLKAILVAEPELWQDLLQIYRNKTAKSYDFDNDPELELKWYQKSVQFSAKFPLNLAQYKGNESDKVIDIVRDIGSRYKELIEHNGLNEILYNDNGKPRKERISQKLFYGIADKYCSDNDLDLSPEVNSGRGSVDFKISKGYKKRVCVELKLASNDIDHGFTSQIEEYQKAEKPLFSFYIVIKTIDNKSQAGKISALLNKRARMVQEGKKPPEIFVVDAIMKPSASRK